MGAVATAEAAAAGEPGRLELAARLQPGGVSIGLAAPAELTAVGELTASVYAAAGLGDDEYHAHLREADDRARRARLLVARGVARGPGDPRPLLGTVTLAGADEAYADIAQAGEAEIRMLAVAPEAEGLGIGRRLVEACHQLAAAGGAHTMVCSVEQQNERAIGLYRRMGYVRAPERDWMPVPDLRLHVLTCPLERQPARSRSCTEASP